MEDKFSLINKTKGRLPFLPLAEMKDEILGKNYNLSIAFVGEKESQTLNKKYRQKNNPTNVLSFPLSKTSGELVLCPLRVREEAKDKEKNFGKNYQDLLGFLVIHGMLHLKGMQHSSKMEKAEEKYDKKYFRGDRRGVLRNQGVGGRISKRRKKS